MENEDEFYAALGRAVSAWAVVEQSLYRLYGAIMQPQLWVVTSSTYNVVQTFRGKLSLVEMAIKASYPEKYFPELVKPWKALNQHLTKKSGRRNDLVHLVVGNDPDLILNLRPDPFNAKAMLAEDYKSKRYFLEDLKLAETEFRKLSEEVDAFTRNLPPPPLLREKRSRSPKNDSDQETPDPNQ